MTTEEKAALTLVFASMTVVLILLGYQVGDIRRDINKLQKQFIQHEFQHEKPSY